MGRYTYNSSVVANAISELNDAIKSLANVTPEIQAGINTITNANGARAIDVDCSKLLKLQEMAEEVIEEDIKTIQAKAQVIEDYENAPWYKKLFSSIGMGLSKFVEGVISGVENITDGAVSIVGFVGGIFNSDFKNSVAEYVAKDHVGDWFNEQYDNGFLKGVEKYSWYGEDSTCANIFKGFGTAAPYIALSFVGGGVGVYTEMAAAALGGIGSGTEAGINKALMNDPNLKAGDVFNKAFGQGVWQGTKNAAMVYLMHKISQTAKVNTDGRYNAQTAGKGNLGKDVTPKTASGFKAKGTGSVGAQAAANNRAIKEVSEEFAETALGRGLSASDEVLGKGVNAITSTAGKIGSKIPGASKAGELFGKIASSTPVQNVMKTVTVAAAKHPSLTTALAGAVFTADQIDEDVINSEYRIQQEQVGSVTVRPTPTLTPSPTPSVTTPLPTTTYPAKTTPGPTPTTPSPTPTSGTTTPGPTTPRPTGSGSGYNPTPSPTGTGSTPAPTQTTSTPAPTGTTPTPTQTQVNPTPTYTSTSYNPTPTPSSGGGGYTEEGYTGEGTQGENDIPDTGDVGDSFSDIVGGNEYTNIPTSAAPITTTTTTTGKKSIIPVIAGLGAATVAGFGTKAYLDKREEGTSEEEFDAEEWEEEDSINVDYEEAMSEDGDYLSPADEFAYQDGEEESTESYEAVNSSELASMQ